MKEIKVTANILYFRQKLDTLTKSKPVQRVTIRCGTFKK